MFKSPLNFNEKAAQMTQKKTIVDYCIAKGLRYEQFDNFSNHYQKGFVFDEGMNQFRKLHFKDLILIERFEKGELTLPINVYKDVNEGYGG
jgi:hypothetical protein